MKGMAEHKLQRQASLQASTLHQAELQNKCKAEAEKTVQRNVEDLVAGENGSQV